MNKSCFRAFAAFFSFSLLTSLCAVQPAAAQDRSGERFAEPARVVANHSVSLDLVGLHYAYELPWNRTGSIIGRVGATFGAQWGSGFFGDYSMWAVAPTIEIEPRWYYGLDRRELKGRSTYGNAGSFLSLRVVNTLPGYISDKNMRLIGATVFLPSWGLRRVWKENWMFEFTTGYAVGFNYEGDWLGTGNALDNIAVELRFGYKF